jgi:hypothetical protein
MILKENPTIDFNKIHVYTIKINIDDANITVTVTITVDGWNEKPTSYEEIIPD